MKKVKVDRETGEIIEKEVLYYNTPRNYRERVAAGVVKVYEENSGISETVPNDAFTTREILQRYAAGIPIGNVIAPTYEAEVDGEAKDFMSYEMFKKMDFAEREAYLDKVIAKKNALEKELRSKAQKDIDNRRKKQLDAHIEMEIKRRSEAVKGRKNDSGKESTSTNDS